MDEDQNKVDVQEETTPDNGDAGKVDGNSPAPSQIPEKFQGKTDTEIIKMYGELERKMGENSNELGNLRSYKDKYEALERFYEQHPEAYEALEKAAKANKDADGKNKSDAPENKESGGANPATDQNRRYLESNIVNEFSRNYGLDNLKSEEKKDMLQKVGNKLLQMVDPTGRKSVDQVLSEIPLENLNGFLEDAYFLVNKNKIVNSSSSPENSFASIGVFPTSTLKSGSQQTSLTNEEKVAAKKMGISEEKYLARKKQLAARNN